MTERHVVQIEVGSRTWSELRDAMMVVDQPSIWSKDKVFLPIAGVPVFPNGYLNPSDCFVCWSDGTVEKLR